MSKKVLYTLEFPVKCSPGILFEFLSSPSGLQEWFADKVDERDGIYSFNWEGSEDKAELMESEENKFIRYRWVHSPKAVSYTHLRAPRDRTRSRMPSSA